MQYAKNPPHVVRYDDKRTFVVIIKHVELYTMELLNIFFARCTPRELFDLLQPLTR